MQNEMQHEIQHGNDMQWTHFSEEDFNKYMDTTDVSDEYLLWYQEKVAHLDNCPLCQRILDKLLQLEAVAAEENWSEGLALLEHEEAIRSRLVAQKLILSGQEERMRQVIAMLYANQMAPTLMYRRDFLKKTSVARGDSVKETDISVKEIERKKGRKNGLQVEYAEDLIRVRVTSDEPKDFTVIVQPGKGTDMVAGADLEPLVGTAVWSQEEQVAVAEFKVDKLAEEYRIYLA